MPDSTKAAQNYYVLFETYTQGMAMQEKLREENIPSRISPAPRAIQRELGCGMSILLMPEDMEAAKECIARHGLKYYDIVALEPQINPNRDRYC